MSKEPFMVSEPAETEGPNSLLSRMDSSEININFKNLFRNRAIIHMFKLKRKRNRYVCLSVIGLLVLLVVIAVVIAVVIGRVKGEPQGPRSDNLVDMVTTPDGLLIKHTMCLVRSCEECRKQFPVDPFPSEAKHCDCEKWHAKIINATCYMCDEKCWKPDDMIEHGEKGNKLECKNSLPVGITCCLIACIKNMDKPPSIGTFKCYSPEIYNESKIEPLYHCQHGKTGDSCQTSNDVPFDCKCHTADFNFTNQSEMMDCNSIPTTTYCYTKINSRRCVCNRKPETKSEALKSC